MKQVLYFIGVMILMTLSVQNTEAAFSSTYVPSNFFDKIQIEAIVPDIISTSWENVKFNESLILKKENMWYKDNEILQDTMGMTFICKANNTQELIKRIQYGLYMEGVMNITMKKYEVPTIELNKNNDTFFYLYLQNQGKKSQKFTINVTYGLEYVIDKSILKTYDVSPNTQSEDFPVKFTLKAPDNMTIGDFDDFVYIVSEVSPLSTDGTITPTIPFTKSYKIYIVDSDKPTGVIILNPKEGDKIGKLIGKTKLNIEWEQVNEPNFMKYQLLISNNSAYSSAMNFTFYDINKTSQEIDFEDFDYSEGKYYIKLKAVDTYKNFNETEMTFIYDEPKFQGIRPIAIIGAIAGICVIGIVLLSRKKPKKETLKEDKPQKKEEIKQKVKVQEHDWEL
jgi:hypothetical protein